MVERVLDHVVEKQLANKSVESVFTVDELLNDCEDVFKDKSAEWLLQRLLQKDKAKHYDHLTFLAKKHSNNLAKVWCTGKPVSFIFALETKSSYFIIWESYNTKEATYIWRKLKKAESNFNEYFEQTTDDISLLRQRTKMAFRKRMKNDKCFHLLEHDYKEPDVGFESLLMNLKLLDDELV